MIERFDVIVVGLGPAGSAAATTLARGGARVLALDSARFPRDKACGDALTPKAFPALESLGVLDAVLDAGASSNSYVWRSPAGRELRLPLSPGPHADPRRDLPLTLPRRTLDALLVRAAVQAGVTVREGHRALGLLRAEGGRVDGVAGRRSPTGARFEARADVVLAADGGLSSLTRVATGAPLPRPAWGARLRLDNVSRPPDGFMFWFERRLLPGYAWIFPLPDGQINVGVGVSAELVRDTWRGVRGLFDTVLRPELRRRFPDARPVGRLQAAPVSTLPPQRPLPPGLLALGDAAGLVDAFSGEGVPFALRSGLDAASAILTYGPRRWVALAAAYGGAVRAQRSDRRLSHTFRALTRSPWLIERAMDVARIRPHLAVHGVATLARANYRGLFGKDAIKALLGL